MRKTLMPALRNLAWAPLPTIDSIEIYDRHNGVPTFGVFHTGDGPHLFWKIYGYTRDVSFWLYAPLSDEDLEYLEDADPLHMLDGIVFNSEHPRYVTVTAASGGNRICFEREWRLAAGLTQDAFHGEVTNFLVEALDVAQEQDLPASRQEIVEQISRAARELVDC